MTDEKKVLVVGDNLGAIAAEALEKLYAANAESKPFVEVVEPEPFVPGPSLLKAVEQFDSSFRDRSFSGRHPELGKMIKCDGCGLRHRSSIIHERRFAKFEDGTPRVAPNPRFYRQPANPYGWRQKHNPYLLIFMNRLQRAQKTA